MLLGQSFYGMEALLLDPGSESRAKASGKSCVTQRADLAVEAFEST